MIRLGVIPAVGCLALAFATAVAAGWAIIPRADAAKAETGIETGALQEKQAKTAETRTYYGVGSCVDCHTGGFKNPSANICRGNEVEIWQRNDKHVLAFQVLGDNRAKAIGKALGPGWEDVQTKKECLTCHSIWIEKQPGVVKGGDLRREEGVSCVACHGPDLTEQPDKDKLPEAGWVEFHGSPSPARREAWRKLPRTYKHDKYGMTDLWDPAKRTQLCASCHIGSVEQGRVVTHEMFAAGHPPLPSFEVVTFSNQMPRHWQYLREKDKSIRDLVMKFHQSEVDLEQTHLLAIGGLVAFRENLQLLAGQAATKDWPELANYSCYACHHELKSKSWRQERGYAGKPGRPPLREWSTALVELGLFHAAANADEAKLLLADWRTRLAALRAVFDTQPFGQQDAVKHKTEELTTWIDGQVKRIKERIALDESKGGYSINASALLLSHLLDSRDKRALPDFDSARQLAWAYQVLYLEAASKHDPEARKKLAKGLETLPAWKGLDDYLRLTLPPGQTKLEASFALGLDRIGQYEPRDYFQHLDAVLKQLKSPP